MRIPGRVALSLALAVPLLTGCKSIFSYHGFSHIKVKVEDAQLLAQYGPKQIEIGRQALGNGEYGAALVAFRNAQHDPVWAAAAHNGMAIAYDQIGRPDLAERYFQQAIADSPDDKRYQANLQHFYADSAATLARTERPDLLAAAMPDPVMIAAAAERPAVVNIVTANPSQATFKLENPALVMRRISDHEVSITTGPAVATGIHVPQLRVAWRGASASPASRPNPAYPVRLVITPNY